MVQKKGLWVQWKGYGFNGRVMGPMEGLWIQWKGYGFNGRIMDSNKWVVGPNGRIDVFGKIMQKSMKMGVFWRVVFGK
jgi:hypothetical protein